MYETVNAQSCAHFNWTREITVSEQLNVKVVLRWTLQRQAAPGFPASHHQVPTEEADVSTGPGGVNDTAAQRSCLL